MLYEERENIRDIIVTLIVDIKVIPRASKNKWYMDSAGYLKCHLKNPPEQGKANKELIKLLAKVLHITQHDIVIIAGQTSRKKKIKIEHDITYEMLLRLLGIERQLDMFSKKE